MSKFQVGDRVVTNPRYWSITPMSTGVIESIRNGWDCQPLLYVKWDNDANISRGGWLECRFDLAPQSEESGLGQDHLEILTALVGEEIKRNSDNFLYMEQLFDIYRAIKNARS